MTLRPLESKYVFYLLIEHVENHKSHLTFLSHKDPLKVENFDC